MKARKATSAIKSAVKTAALRESGVPASAMKAVKKETEELKEAGSKKAKAKKVDLTKPSKKKQGDMERSKGKGTSRVRRLAAVPEALSTKWAKEIKLPLRAA